MEVLGLTVREISLLYSLPHPLSVLEQPCLKNRTRNSPSILLLVSGKGNSAAPLTSLVFFKPQYHSLVTHMDPRSQPTWGLQGSYSAENVEWQISDCNTHKTLECKQDRVLSSPWVSWDWNTPTLISRLMKPELYLGDYGRIPPTPHSL